MPVSPSFFHKILDDITLEKLEYALKEGVMEIGRPMRPTRDIVDNLPIDFEIPP
jgi:hypothetical protein